MMCIGRENAVAGGDALQYRYIVREIGQTLTTTVDACRVGLVAALISLNSFWIWLELDLARFVNKSGQLNL